MMCCLPAQAGKKFMESIGQKLKKAREAMGIELDQAARETNIAPRYLEDLENEKFDEFPGESYIVGFLRNYCEYLDLDADEIVGLYKNQKVQEVDVPVSVLLGSKQPLGERVFGGGTGKVLVALIVVAAVAALGFGGYTLILRMPRAERQPRQTAASSRPSRTPQAYEMTGREFRGRVFAGDSIAVTVADETFLINVRATASEVSLEIGGAIRTVELGQEISFDVTDDGRPDIRVFVSDLEASNPDAGAEITLETGSFGEQQALEAEEPIVLSETRTSARASGQTVLFESASAYPVTLNATFRGNCLFRYEIDRRSREERLYQRSETLTIQARDGFRIWASNGNAVRLQVVAGGRTIDLELSRPGEVIVKDIRWVWDRASSRYRFVVMDVE